MGVVPSVAQAKDVNVVYRQLVARFPFGHCWLILETGFPDAKTRESSTKWPSCQGPHLTAIAIGCVVTLRSPLAPALAVPSDCGFSENPEEGDMRPRCHREVLNTLFGHPCTVTVHLEPDLAASTRSLSGLRAPIHLRARPWWSPFCVFPDTWH